ncbi:mitochondrial carrier domain-containing protein [Irpex rosettiformis]|uniref:Mitochondrial carrier domain-containing protein n=1 Tax=Irpex rosettiformis TaxID=378272 RepID=A0ACB8TYM8_9APHY|nr:mitochondrial carrier domain-containing protein [Irpex rosettiformis]
MTSTLPPLIQAFSGSIGSAAANTIVYPLDLVTTRLQTTSSRKLRGLRGILLTLRHIIYVEGWSGLYDGLNADTAATLLSNFLYFYFYTFLRRIVARRKPSLPRGKGRATPVLLSAPKELGIGFLAGLASRAISQPLSVITVRLQTEGEVDEGDSSSEDGENAQSDTERRVGAAGIVKKIYNEQGLEGFWGGFTTTVPLCLSPAITLFLFQLFQRLITLWRPHKQTSLGTPSAGSAFLGAAFSNATATALLYPLILAKTQLQAHKKSLKENGNADWESQKSKLREDGGMNMLSIWERTVRKEGVGGLYQGLEAQITKGFVSEGVKMMVKQRYV